MMNMNFYAMSSMEIMMSGLRAGDVDVVALLEDAKVKMDDQLRSDIVSNPRAPKVFSSWMRRNLAEHKDFLVRINYGTKKAAISDSTLYMHENVFGASHEDNVAALEAAFDLVRASMVEGRYLYHTLSNRSLKMQVDLRDCAAFAHLNVDGLDDDGIVKFFRSIVQQFSDKPIIRNAISYALLGEGEPIYDKSYRVYGVATDDLGAELHDACWEYVSRHLRYSIMEKARKEVM